MRFDFMSLFRLMVAVLFCLTVVTTQQSHAFEDFRYKQLLQDILSAAMNDVEIQERDALYPITRYAGMGYNLLRGNPEGDFSLGGKDPGIQSTRWIYNLTYTMGREGYYGKMTVTVPDQVEFHPSQTSALQSLTRAYSGQTSYQKELNRNVNAGISGGYQGITSLGFSLSTGMKEVEKKTRNSRHVIIQRTEVSNMGSVRYKDELITDKIDPYILSRGFKNAIQYLPKHFSTEYEQTLYMNFIEDWGTHVILSAEIGTRRMQKKSATYSDIFKEISRQKSFGGSLNGGIGISGASASGKIGIDLKTINDNIDKLEELETTIFETKVGSKESPAPIHLELKPIAEVLSQNAWGPTWQEDGISAIKGNLRQALNLYPVHVGAHISKDPQIEIQTELQWLGGSFALPAPASECPKGFETGSITQDTYNLVNNNDASYGITHRLNVDVRQGSITTHFCVKISSSMDDKRLDWPKGSYCVGKRGLACPDHFSEGFIKWDDKDFRNKNKHKGVLPEGEYGKNTLIYFCCRSDNGSPRNPMAMPTDVPFVLYRYGGACQEIIGMKAREDYIIWNNEFALNKDEVSGSYPDDNPEETKQHKLHYCHYSPIGG